MANDADTIIALAEQHADAILRASGSALRNYTMDATRGAILLAVLDCIQDGMRRGANMALEAAQDAAKGASQ